jgi:hypothetical protein
MEENYWKLDDMSILTIPYVYVDHFKYLADNLFGERKVKIKWQEELEKKDSPYRVIFCRVRKRDAAGFEEALEKLKDKMLILGHRDYPEVCNEVRKIIDRERGCVK